MNHPCLPWEVIERVIKHSGDNLKTLCSFSVSCRQLRPQSRCSMFTRVDLTKGMDRVFEFIDLLQANAELKPFVNSVIFSPTSFGSSLLYILPNLSSIDCVRSRNPPTPGPSLQALDLHRSSLACFARLGTNIQTLRLSNVSFSTSAAFIQLLLAFTSVTHLVCERVDIERASSEAPLPEAIRQRLSKQTQLKALTVSISTLLPNSMILKTELLTFWYLLVDRLSVSNWTQY